MYAICDRFKYRAKVRTKSQSGNTGFTDGLQRTRFLHRLSENFEGIKITTALQTFDQLDFKGFVAELKKQKIKLTLAQQDEWEDYFNQYRQACQELSAQIKATDNEIDNKVFDLYGLTPEEREIVMGK